MHKAGDRPTLLGSPLRLGGAASLLAVAALAPVQFVAAPAAALLLAYFPGRVAIELFRLRGDCRGTRCLLSLALSLAIAPVFLNPLWHFANHREVLIGGAWLVLVAGSIALAIVRRRACLAEPDCGAPRLFETRGSRLLAVFVGVVLAVGCVGTYWPADGPHGPAPSPVHDFIKHYAVLWSLERAPLPLGNPFFADDADGPAYYYHFFYLIPATVRAVSPSLSIHAAFAGQGLLVSLATAGMFYLLAKRLTQREAPAMLALALATVVGGLDVIPLAVLNMRVITLDAWADTLVRIHALLTQMVWTPQNVQGVLITLVGAYALSARGSAGAWIVLLPLLGASLLGSTIWVAAIALPAALLWFLADLRRGPSRVRRLFAGLAAAMLTLAASWPSLAGYAETSRRHGKSLTLEWPHQQHALLGRFAPPGPLANLLDLPWVIVIEFGALAILPLLRPRAAWRRMWSDAGGRFLLIGALLALIGFITLRSHFRYNDFGQKAILAALAAAVVLSACAWDAGMRHWRRVIAAAVIVPGLAVSLLQTPAAAVRRFVAPGSPLHAIALPAALRAQRESAAIHSLREQLPPGAVVQAHWSDGRLELQQLIGRQIGVMELQEDTHVFQGSCGNVQTRAVESLAVAIRDADATELAAVLRGLRVTHVFVGEVERQAWPNLGRFQDASRFRTVFEDNVAAVYAVNP